MILSFVIGVTYYLNDLDRLEVITTMYKPQSNDMKISGEMTVKYMKKLLRIKNIIYLKVSHFQINILMKLRLTVCQ